VDALEVVLARDGGRAVGAAQLNEVPSGQTARYWTLVVGSRSSLSGALKSRVLRTRRVAVTVEPSAHWCGTAQNASAVSSKNNERSADADVEDASAASRAANPMTTLRRHAAVVFIRASPGFDGDVAPGYAVSRHLGLRKSSVGVTEDCVGPVRRLELLRFLLGQAYLRSGDRVLKVPELRRPDDRRGHRGLAE
jgi:hypothetical protein